MRENEFKESSTKKHASLNIVKRKSKVLLSYKTSNFFKRSNI